jgi:hypothetical protein
MIINEKNTSAMKSKLTLTIEQTIIEKAKKLVKQEDRSLSNIVENYLIVIKKEDTSENITLTPIIKSLESTSKAAISFDYKKELTKRLTRKYL